MEAELLALLEDVLGLTELDEFRVGLLAALHRAIPSDWVSLNDVGPGPMDVAVIAIPEIDERLIGSFARYKDQNPLVAHATRTRDGRAYRFSDFVTQDELHALDLYREVYGPLGVEYQIAFTLPHDADRILGVALSRGDRDYSDDERDLINRARPMLIQTFRTAIEHERLRTEIARLRGGADLTDALRRAGFTPREAEVMRFVAQGRSNRDIAAALRISDRTVGKHLERGFRTLGVTRRSAAAARVWEIAESNAGV